MAHCRLHTPTYTLIHMLLIIRSRDTLSPFNRSPCWNVSMCPSLLAWFTASLVVATCLLLRLFRWADILGWLEVIKHRHSCTKYCTLTCQALIKVIISTLILHHLQCDLRFKLSLGTLSYCLLRCLCLKHHNAQYVVQSIVLKEICCACFQSHVFIFVLY